NLAPTADILTEILTNARAINPNAKVRGVATNVANFNGLGKRAATNLSTKGTWHRFYKREGFPLILLLTKEEAEIKKLLEQVATGATSAKLDLDHDLPQIL
ncbi:hypothetical protein FRC02_010846, partial [Tulasnella sp. 418]